MLLKIDIGETEYNKAWSLQKYIHNNVSTQNIPNTLIFAEHPHTITLGRRGNVNDVLAPKSTLSKLKITTYSTDRGGEVTYHGPGQLIIYPIINLKQFSIGPLKYVELLQETLIEVLSYFDINSNKSKNPVGVWVNNDKIAAIGIRISKNTTMHGLALNIDPDLSYFQHIIPCGNANLKPTSIKNLLKNYPDKKTITKLFIQIFLNKLNRYDAIPKIKYLDNFDIIKIQDESSNIVQKKLEVEHIFNSNSYITRR